MKFIKDLFVSLCFEIAGASGLLAVVCAINVFFYDGSKEVMYVGIVGLILFFASAFYIYRTDSEK